MKAAAFDYVRASSVDEICRLLADAGDDERKIIAGGQTLVPLMAMRMARPDMLIDINDVTELAGIIDRGDHISFGAGTRQRAIETIGRRIRSITACSRGSAQCRPSADPEPRHNWRQHRTW